MLAAVSVLVAVLLIVLVVILIAVLVIVLIVVLVLVVILVAVLLIVLVLVVLIIHLWLPPNLLRCAAGLSCPHTHDLSFALKIRLISRAITTAAVMPPAVAFKPPVRMPIKPL